jgi:hypothetical protein
MIQRFRPPRRTGIGHLVSGPDRYEAVPGKVSRNRYPLDIDAWTAMTPAASARRRSEQVKLRQGRRRRAGRQTKNQRQPDRLRLESRIRSHGCSWRAGLRPKMIEFGCCCRKSERFWMDAAAAPSCDRELSSWYRKPEFGLSIVFRLFTVF